MVIWQESKLDGVAWGELSHAYGSAEDTPGHLRGLTSADPATRKAALAHLRGRLTHQQSLHTATAPAAEMVARMLPDHRLSAPAPLRDGRSMRTHLLLFLGHVAGWSTYYQSNPDIVAYVRRDDPEPAAFEAVWEPGHDPEYVVVGRLGSGCARRAETIAPLLVSWLDTPHPAERGAALYATACWVGLVPNHSLVPGRALERLREAARDTTLDPRARIDCVLALAALGDDTAGLLDDASTPVRACAALSPAVAAHPRTLEILNAALAASPECDRWIDELPPAPYLGKELSARLVEAILRCTGDRESWRSFQEP